MPPRFRSANFILKSTVPIGTTRRLAHEYGLTNLVHCPEFLNSRTAIWDAQNPTQVLLGYVDWKRQSSGSLISSAMTARFPGVPIRELHSEETEAAKLFINAFGAAKVALFNEFKQLCDAEGLSWDDVREAMLGDGRIHPQWTQVPGPDGKPGFGGKCLPKDLDQLLDCYEDAELAPRILPAVKDLNWKLRGGGI